MWVKVNIGTGAVEQYPYNRRDLKADNPLVSFPKVISSGDLAALGVHEVIVDDEPAWDESIETGVRDSTVTKVSSTYHLQFTVTAKSGAEQTTYFENKREEILRQVETKSGNESRLGVTVDSEFVPTDLESLNSLFATAINTANSRKTKTGRGTFVTLNPAQLKTRREGVDQFLQDIIDNEESLSVDINAAADLTALLAIDIEAGWPT